MNWRIVLNNLGFGWPQSVIDEATELRDRYLHEAARPPRLTIVPDAVSFIAPTRCRYRKLEGGAIIEIASGRALAHVMVNQLDTATADRVSNAIIAALMQSPAPPEQPGPLPLIRPDGKRG